MKIVSVLFFTIILLFNTSCSISPKTEVDQYKFINIETSKILDGFLQNGFEIADNNDGTKPYVIINKKDSSDIGIKVYTSSQLSKVNAIVISITLNENTVNTGSDSVKRPLNDKTFNDLKNALSALNCNKDVDFLRASFICENGNYNITYTINTDSFDKLRNIFGYNKRSELSINIIPIN